MKQNSILWNGITVFYRYNDKNLQIVDSYRFKRSDMLPILQIIRKEIAKEGITYKRTNESWQKEWCAHNSLYNIGIERERTKSVDLSESESGFRRACYSVLALFCK